MAPLGSGARLSLRESRLLPRSTHSAIPASCAARWHLLQLQRSARGMLFQSMPSLIIGGGGPPGGTPGSMKKYWGCCACIARIRSSACRSSSCRRTKAWLHSGQRLARRGRAWCPQLQSDPTPPLQAYPPPHAPQECLIGLSPRYCQRTSLGFHLRVRGMY